jgi:hypothetical protein
MSARGWRVRAPVAPGAASGNDRGSEAPARVRGEVDRASVRILKTSARGKNRHVAMRAVRTQTGRTSRVRARGDAGRQARVHPGHRVDVLLLVVVPQDGPDQRPAHAARGVPPVARRSNLQVRQDPALPRDVHRLERHRRGALQGQRGARRGVARGGRRRVHLLHRHSSKGDVRVSRARRVARGFLVAVEKTKRVTDGSHSFCTRRIRDFENARASLKRRGARSNAGEKIFSRIGTTTLLGFPLTGKGRSRAVFSRSSPFTTTSS